MAPTPVATVEPGISGVIKRELADWQVNEKLDIDFTDEGEHAYFLIEKTARNTSDVAFEVAQFHGLQAYEVGYAGRKDKHGLTQQWFSVPHISNQWPLLIKGTRCLQQRRHIRKLRRGVHTQNNFIITLRDVVGCDADTFTRLVGALSAGFSNAFGVQRLSSSNVEQAMAWIAQRRKRRISQSKKGWMLSVLRSFLFNQVLELRIENDTFNTPLCGDNLLNGVPTAPLWGRGRSSTQGEALELENQALAPYQELCEMLEYAGVDQGRRGLVSFPQNLQVTQIDETTFRLEFALPPGSYATAMLASILTVHDDSVRHV